MHHRPPSSKGSSWTALSELSLPLLHPRRVAAGSQGSHGARMETPSCHPSPKSAAPPSPLQSTLGPSSLHLLTIDLLLLWDPTPSTMPGKLPGSPSRSCHWSRATRAPGEPPVTTLPWGATCAGSTPRARTAQWRSRAGRVALAPGLGHGALACPLGRPVALMGLPTRTTEAHGPKSAHN
jgi:hypothetical protein